MNIQRPFTMMIAGPSGCGKTCFVLKLLKLFREPFENILWCNAEPNAVPKEIRSSTKLEVCESLPESFKSVPNNSLIILDDLMTEAYNKNVCELFTKGSHHKNISVILITQNVFHQGKYCRDISLNCKYMVIFKNPRDKSQILPLARQIYPENPNEFVKVYKEATDYPHGYLWLDLTQSASDLIRFQTDIFNKKFLTCFCPKPLLNLCEKNETIDSKQTYATRI